MKKSIKIISLSIFMLPFFFNAGIFAQEIEDVKQQYEYAGQLMSANQCSAALKEYLKVIYLYPDNDLKENALCKVTECLVKIDNPWAAIEQCKKFIEKHPNSKLLDEVKKRLITAIKISHTGASMGYYDPPLTSLKEKLASKYIDFGTDFLDNSATQGDTGEYVYNKEKLDKAFYWFDKVIKEFPDTYIVSKAQYYKGKAYIKQERQADYNKAIEELKKVADNYPNTMWADEALKLTGDIYKDNLVDKNKAIESYQKLIDKKKNDVNDYYVSYSKAVIKSLQ